jgi:hypothetical protein
MKQVIIALIVLSNLSQAFAGCLEGAPRSETERQRQIKLAKQRLNTATEAEKFHFEIAQDAHQRSGLAKTTGIIALAPAGVAVSIATFWMAAIGGSKIMAGLFFASLGMNGTGLWHGVKQALRASGVSEIEISKAEQQHRVLVRDVGIVCSYADARRMIKLAKEELYENELSGSVWNNVKDRATLGSLSKDATYKLYTLSVLEKDIASRELKELSEMNVSSGVAAQANLGTK